MDAAKEFNIEPINIDNIWNKSCPRRIEVCLEAMSKEIFSTDMVSW